MSPNQHDSKPQRRDGDAPHPWEWWLKWVAGIVGSLTIILGSVFAGLTSAREQVAAPILRKLDAQAEQVTNRLNTQAERDSLRLGRETAARIAADSQVSAKLDLMISILRDLRRGNRGE